MRRHLLLASLLDTRTCQHHCSHSPHAIAKPPWQATPAWQCQLSSQSVLNPTPYPHADTNRAHTLPCTNTSTANIGDGDEGPGEDQSDLPGSGINFNLKQVIYDGTNDKEPSSTNEAGQRWANEEAGPVDTGAVAADETAGDAAGDAASDAAGDASGDDGDGPEPVEVGFEAGAVEPLPDAPDFVPMWMRKAGQGEWWVLCRYAGCCGSCML